MKKLLSLLILLCILFASACNGESGPIDESTSTDSSEPTPYPVVINDVTFSESPNNVVCLSPFLGEILYELGYGDRIIGRSSYCEYPSEIKSAKDLGSSASPDIDAILALSPDVVLTATPIAYKDQFLLEQNGIPVLLFTTPQSLSALSHVYEILGLLFEGIFTGEQTGKEAFQSIDNAVKSAEKNAETFAYITQDYAVAGGNTLESDILSLFGNNVASDWKDYSFEPDLLLEYRPSIVFLSNRYTVDTLLEDEVFSQLDAVQERRVVIIDNMYFERPTGRLTELIKKISDDISSLNVTVPDETSFDE